MARWAMEVAYLQKPFPLWMLRRKDASFARWLFSLLAASIEGNALRERFSLYPEVKSALHAELVTGTLPEPYAEAPNREEAPLAFDRVQFRERLDWVYPHLSAVRLPAKLSVSELKGIRKADEDAEELLEERPRLFRPRFASRFQPRGNEVGNAMHQALQFSDFSRLKENPEKELDRLVAEGFILQKQREMIPVEMLRHFTASESFSRLLKADYYSKEERFLFPMPADALFGSGAEGEILIQGVLDCYSVRNGEAVILDYKTDRVRTEAELIHRYRVQMELYEEALRRVKGLSMVRWEIYSFALEKSIAL